MLWIRLNNAGRWVCDRLTEEADFGKKKIIFLDEAHFDLGGYVNKQNFHIWGTENPHAYIERPTYPKRITVWWGFWSRGIIESWARQRQSMLNKSCSQKLKRRILATFGCNRTALCAHSFVFRIISRRADVIWPPRSCDLTPLDYYLWGAVKDKCYTDKPETIDALK